MTRKSIDKNNNNNNSIKNNHRHISKKSMEVGWEKDSEQKL